MNPENSIEAPSGFARQEALCLLILLALGAGVFFGTMGCRDLWEPEELRYAEVTREMVQNNEWIVLHLNGEKYPDKPPLFYWAIALAAKVTGGLTEFAVRLPCVISGLGVLLFTFLFGRRLYGAVGGFLSGLFLLTMPFFLQMSIEARMDMMLTLFISAALFCLYVAYVDGYGLWLYLVAYFLMGLGVLTKGPVAALLTLITFAAFALFKDNLQGTGALRRRGGVLIARVRGAFRIRLRPIPLRLGWGVLVILAVVCPWLVPACVMGGLKHTYELLFHQNVTRYFDSWTHQDEPFLLYFVFVPLQVLPWALFLPAVMIFGFMREPIGERWQRRFPLVWFLTVLLFFTFCSSKRWIYTLPIVPAAALLLGGLVKDYFVPKTPCRLSQITRGAYGSTLWLVAYLSLTALLAYPIVAWGGRVFASWSDSLALVKEWLGVAAAGAFIGAAGGICALIAWRRARPWTSFGVLILTLLLAWSAWCWTFFPYRNRVSSAKIMLAEVKRFLKPGERLYTYGTERNGYAFYWDREPPIEQISRGILTETDPVVRKKREEEARNRFFELYRSPTPFLCLTYERTLNTLKQTPGFEPHVLASGLMGSRNLVLISNQPRASSVTR